MWLMLILMYGVILFFGVNYGYWMFDLGGELDIVKYMILLFVCCCCLVILGLLVFVMGCYVYVR